VVQTLNFKLENILNNLLKKPKISISKTKKVFQEKEDAKEFRLCDAGLA
jgi:hypothetical protein